MWLTSNRQNIFTNKLASAIYVALAFFVFSNSNLGQCPRNDVSFKNGERLDFDVYYYLKKMWVPAGKVRFEVKDSLYNGKNCFLLDGKGKTLKSYDYFFKVRDQYASIVDKESLAPQKFVRHVREGGFELYYDYRFDNDKEKAVVYTDKNDQSKKSSLEFPKCTYDVITSVYYARCLNFDNLKINDTIPLRMMVDKEVYENVYIRYTGRTRKKADDGTVYNCIKFRPLLIEGTIFSEGEFMEVYVTDDKNHIPIYVEAQILVGSIRAFLTDFQNLKYPIESKVR